MGSPGFGPGGDLARLLRRLGWVSITLWADSDNTAANILEHVLLSTGAGVFLHRTRGGDVGSEVQGADRPSSPEAALRGLPARAPKGAWRFPTGVGETHGPPTGVPVL